MEKKKPFMVYKCVKGPYSNRNWHVAQMEVVDKGKTLWATDKAGCSAEFGFGSYLFKRDEGRTYFLTKLDAIRGRYQSKIELRDIYRKKMDQCQLDLLHIMRLQKREERRK